MTRRYAVIAVVALSALAAPGAVPAQSPPALGNAVAGEQLFRARGCLECHAADVAQLQQHPQPLFTLAAAMWNHFPRMAEHIRASDRGRPYLTSGEMRDLVAFLDARARDGAPVTEAHLLGTPGDPARGRQLVADKRCLECHSTSAPASGKPGGSFADIKGFDSPWVIVAQMWNHAFRMQLEQKDKGIAWAPLNATEMADLVAYLRTLMRTR